MAAILKSMTWRNRSVSKVSQKGELCHLSIPFFLPLPLSSCLMRCNVHDQSQDQANSNDQHLTLKSPAYMGLLARSNGFPPVSPGRSSSFPIFLSSLSLPISFLIFPVVAPHQDHIQDCVDSCSQNGRCFLSPRNTGLHLNTQTPPKQTNKYFFLFVLWTSFLVFESRVVPFTVNQYAKLLPLQLAGQYIEAAIQVIEASEAGVPVKISAVRAPIT
jgi:hypothetical protein